MGLFIPRISSECCDCVSFALVCIDVHLSNMDPRSGRARAKFLRASSRFMITRVSVRFVEGFHVSDVVTDSQWPSQGPVVHVLRDCVLLRVERWTAIRMGEMDTATPDRQTIRQADPIVACLRLELQGRVLMT